MSPTISFRLQTDEQKEYVSNVINEITDRFPDEISIKGDALFKVCTLIKEGIDSILFRETPTSVQYTLDQIKCKFIKYEGTIAGYLCYENFHKKKSMESIGLIDEIVIQRCKLCIEGKKDSIIKEVEKKLRSKNIKSILDLRDILINLTRESSLAQIFICKANLLEENSIFVSIDGIHLRCPLQNNETMSVLEHCYNQVNPQDMNPPCRYLIDPHINIKMEPDEDAQEIIRDLTQIEDQSEEKIKTIDAEVIEPEEEIEPKSDEEKKENK